jgi:FAD/FMN-containing dehydrogenase
MAIRSGTSIAATAVDAWAATMRGSVLRPVDEGYDAGRRVWNGMADRYPAFIARCAGRADVMSSLAFAREHGLTIAVRGGGHSVAGNGTCDGGIVIDLSPMKAIQIDPENRVARAQGGATWGDLDRESQQFGRAVTGGLVSSTGIAGLTLGGGQGWLARKLGLASDNLLAADIVTADGRLVRASEEENPDLFWGIRGGGGNFGIVTSFEYQLHPVGPAVLAGPLFYALEDAAPLLRVFRDYMADAPDELGALCAFFTAPAESFLPEHVHGRVVAAVLVCYAGDLERGEEVLRPLRTARRPLADLVAPVPYAALQASSDAGHPPGQRNYWKSSYVNHLSDGLIETAIAHVAQMSSPMITAYFLRLEGAISRLPEDHTAYSHREAGYDFNILTKWVDPQEDEQHIGWTRSFWEAMQPFASCSVYVNNLGSEGSDRIREAYTPAKWARLVALKNRYDPANVFRLNQNINPAP